MTGHDPNPKRIVIERVTVTTVRTGTAWQKITCDVCRREIEPTELVSSQQIEKEQIDAPALTAAEGNYPRIGDRK